MTDPKDKPVSDMAFEEALGELETIVAQLEAGDVPLERSIAIYERGAALRAHCEAVLKRAEARIEKIVEASDGAVVAKPLDEDGP